MKIKNVNSVERGIQGSVSPEIHGEAGPRPLLFKRTLTDMSSEQREHKLSGLMENIDAQAERLMKRSDIGEFVRYRQLIRDFLDEVVSSGYTFSKESSFEARGRHRYTATIKTIDEKLDELAKDVLKEQSDNISLLNKIDDIRGLLLDMML